MIPDNPDKEWADMKTGWQSTSISETFMTEKLRWSLRLRMIGSWLWLGLEVVSMLMVAAIAIFEFMRGNLVGAVALTVFDLVAAGASIWARRSPLRRTSGNLVELIDLTIQRARRSERFAWAQYFTTAAAIVFVVAMFFNNAGVSMEPYNDAGRATVAVVIFVVYAIGVGVYHWYARQRGRRFRELRQNFTSQTKEPDSL
jgi:uncharacterized membrane protein